MAPPPPPPPPSSTVQLLPSHHFDGPAVTIPLFLMTPLTQFASSRRRGVEKVAMYVALGLTSVSARSSTSLLSPVCHRALFQLAVLDPGGSIFHPCFVGVAIDFLVKVDEATNPGHVGVISTHEVSKTNYNFDFDCENSGPSIGFATGNMKHMKCGDNCIPYSCGFANGGSQSMGVERFVFKNEELLVGKGEVSYCLLDAISGCDSSLIVASPLNKLKWLMIWCSLDIDVAYDPVQNSCVCLGWVWYQDGFDIMHQGEGVSGNPEIPTFLVD